MNDGKYVDAYNLILEWRIEEFENRNKRTPDDFEVDAIERMLSESDIRAALSYLGDDNESA